VNYKEAKQKIVIKKLLYTLLYIVGLVSTAISILKMLYFKIGDEAIFGSIISAPVKRIVHFIYENTRKYINIFWDYSPAPDITNIFELGNLYFIFVYLLIFIGFALYSSGSKLAKRLKNINIDIEDQLIKESIKGNDARTRKEIENQINIPKQGIFDQVHLLYLAPIITAVVGGVILKLLGF